MRSRIILLLVSVLYVPGIIINAQPAPSGNSYSSEIVINETLIPEVFRNEELSYEYCLELLDNRIPINLVYNEEVKKHIDLYLNKKRRDLEISLQRAEQYFPIFEQILDKYDLPLELKYIAVIESGLNPRARSSSGAVGLWQFLYQTSSLFDLKIDSYIDERRDPYKSTEAACRYFKYLYSTFNDWNLVLASYNDGPGEVRKAIARSNGQTDYWKIRQYLPEQSANYVPAFVAVNYLMNYYHRHGIPYHVKNNRTETDTVQINYAVSFRQISAVINIPLEILRDLNPIYRKDFIPDLAKPCILVLPEDKVLEFIKNEKKITGYRIPETNYNVLLANAGNTENCIKKIHIVRHGEYIHKIALTYNCTLENIMAWNQLNNLSVNPGQELEIWVPVNE